MVPKVSRRPSCPAWPKGNFEQQAFGGKTVTVQVCSKLDVNACLTQAPHQTWLQVKVMDLSDEFETWSPQI